MFLSLEIAKQSLINSQTALSVSSNNIANANTEGYTRQVAKFESNWSIKGSSGRLLGTGANITSIQRVKSTLYDVQYRNNNSLYSQNSTQAEAMQQLESLLGTMDSKNGLKINFTSFSNSLQELSKLPQDIGLRNNVIQNAQSLADNFKGLSTELSTLKTEYSKQTVSEVDEINGIIKNLRIVNDEIVKFANSSDNHNELLDKRDLLLDELSQKIDIQVSPASNNSINVTSNGHVVLESNRNTLLKAEVQGDESVKVYWGDNNSEFSGMSGELGGLLNITNNIIDSYSSKIDTLASDYIKAFNDVFSSGFGADGSTGLNFFEGTDASTISVSTTIINSPDKFAASLDGSIGDNGNLLNLIALNKNPIINGTSSPTDFLNDTLTLLAQETKNNINRADNYNYVKDEIDIARKNISGVSTDEELLNIQKFQQSFAATSKIIQTISAMFDDLMKLL